jgi:hypothetical protein
VNLLLLGGGGRGGGGSSCPREVRTYSAVASHSRIRNRIALPQPSPCPHPKTAPTIPTRSHRLIPRSSHRPFPLRSRHHSLTPTIALPVLSMIVSSTLQCFYFFSGIPQDVARKLILKPCFLKCKNTKKQQLKKRRIIFQFFFK